MFDSEIRMTILVRLEWEEITFIKTLPLPLFPLNSPEFARQTPFVLTLFSSALRNGQEKTQRLLLTFLIFFFNVTFCDPFAIQWAVVICKHTLCQYLQWAILLYFFSSTFPVCIFNARHFCTITNIIIFLSLSFITSNMSAYNHWLRAIFMPGHGFKLLIWRKI